MLFAIRDYINAVVKINDELDSFYKPRQNLIGISTNSVATAAHEITHAIDKNNKDKLSKNPKIIEAYKKEMDYFKNHTTPHEFNAIFYFSPLGGKQDVDTVPDDELSTGIDEFVAETCALLTTYGNTNEKTQERIMYLSRYFPETIALIGNQLKEISMF